MNTLEIIVLVLAGLGGAFLGYKSAMPRNVSSEARYEAQVAREADAKAILDKGEQEASKFVKDEKIAMDPTVDISDTLGKLIDQGRISP